MTDCCDSTDFWLARLAAARTSAADIEDAITALTIGGVSSYRLATGQTDQMVTKTNLSTLKTLLDSTLNRVASLEARLGCGGSTHVKPGY